MRNKYKMFNKMKPFTISKGGGQKKSCNIVTTYVGERTGDYNKFIYFFHGPNSSKSAKKFFLLSG